MGAAPGHPARSAGGEKGQVHEPGERSELQKWVEDEENGDDGGGGRNGRRNPLVRYFEIRWRFVSPWEPVISSLHPGRFVVAWDELQRTEKKVKQNSIAWDGFEDSVPPRMESFASIPSFLPSSGTCSAVPVILA